jgi:hypothetical protein
MLHPEFCGLLGYSLALNGLCYQLDESPQIREETAPENDLEANNK